MCYKLGHLCLLQIRASVVTNWGSYYKLGQPLLQNKAAITNWDKMYYILGQVLQIRATITNWGITQINDLEFLGAKLGLLSFFKGNKDIKHIKVWRPRDQVLGTKLLIHFQYTGNKL